MNKQKNSFHFFQGFFSIFFGISYGRMRKYYNSYRKISESEAIKQDFKRIGDDIHRAMRNEVKKSNLK